MAITTIEIDPQGDTLIVLPHPPESSDSNTPIETENAEPPLSPSGHDPKDSPCPENDGETTHFKVSKKHLAVASPRARTMFAGGFKESLPQEDGFLHWNFEPIFDPKAFLIIMNIIHGKTRSLPQQVTFEMLAYISTIVDDLQCHDAVWFFAKRWLNDIPKDIPDVICQDLVRWILISVVFDEQMSFTQSTRIAIIESEDVMPTFNLPILPRITDLIDSTRQNILEQIINHIHDIMTKLCRKEAGCDFGCRSMMLGALIQEMNSALLFSPRPSKPFPGLSVRSTIESLQALDSPDYFCPGQKRPYSGHDESWDYCSGYKPSAYQTTKQKRIMKGENQTVDIPRTLLHHTCSLGDLIAPKMDQLHRGIKGLELFAYGRKNF
ncbi:hypothetical protein B0J13DRAFT_38090 [Dactylonectria estremocensis]|uniref:BTB domain-containing protein n=1 Tax=Dactylonectria estremocensis TaxID=1079267 RepID=A0A9P9FL75_9HYPO|nr:hypothetical protein B0J13DRAFT_38090 [Dactylonectria estremocensis]